MLNIFMYVLVLSIAGKFVDIYTINNVQISRYKHFISFN